MNTPTKDTELNPVKTYSNQAWQTSAKSTAPLWAGSEPWCYFLFPVLLGFPFHSLHTFRNRTWRAFLIKRSFKAVLIVPMCLVALLPAMRAQSYLQERKWNNTHQCWRKPGSLPTKNFISHQDHFSPSLQLLFQASCLCSLQKKKKGRRHDF